MEKDLLKNKDKFIKKALIYEKDELEKLKALVEDKDYILFNKALESKGELSSFSNLENPSLLTYNKDFKIYKDNPFIRLKDFEIDSLYKNLIKDANKALSRDLKKDSTKENLRKYIESFLDENSIFKNIKFIIPPFISYRKDLYELSHNKIVFEEVIIYFDSSLSIKFKGEPKDDFLENIIKVLNDIKYFLEDLYYQKIKESL